MNRPAPGLCLLLVLSSGAPSQAAEPRPNPEDAAIEKVAAAAMQATQKLDWKKFAGMMHPEALKEFKELIVPALKSADKKGPRARANMLALFDDARDISMLIDLEPGEFFARFLKGLTARQPGLKDVFAKMDARMIGTVHEGKDLAHVVARIEARVAESPLRKMEVISLKRSGTEWRMLLSMEVRGMAEQLRRGLAE